MATAVKVYQNVQFNGGADLEYPRVHNVAGTSNLPSDAKIGTMVWNTSDNCMYVCYATSPSVAWKKFGAGGAVVEEDGTGAGVKVTAGTASTDGTVTYKIKAYDIKDTHIASNADITWSKLKAGTASSVMVTNASGVPTTTSILPVVNGGTGASTFTADRLLVGAGTGAITVLGQATSGYILYGNSSNKPVWSSRTGAGLALASGVSSSTGVASGWYRIAQSTVGIDKCFGLFRLHTTTSGIHNVILFTAGCSFGATASVNITQLSNTSYSSSGVTKLRIVYTPTYTNNRAYLELYDVTTAALAVQVRMIEGLGWTLVAPNTAGGIPTSPTNYTSKELTLTRQALQTSDEIKGEDLTASGTVTFSGLDTAGIVHNSASGVLSTSLVSLSADVTGTLPVAHGGIGTSSLTANRLLVGNGTSAVTVLAQGTNDYVLVGRGSSVPAWVEKAPKATLADTASKVANKLTILRWKGDVEDWDTDIEYDGSSAHTIQIQTVYGNGILRGQGNGIVKYVYSSTPGQLLARVNTNEQYDFVDFPIYFATCGTDAATTTKVATCSGVRKLTSLVKGTVVYVTFTVTNTGAVGSLRLKVDDTADYPLKQFYNTSVANLNSASQILANQTVRFVFDGTNWVGLFNYNSNTTYSLISDAELQDSASIVAKLISGQRFATALEASLLTLPSSDTAGRLLLSGVGTNKASWLGVGTTDYVLVQTANGPAWAEKAPKAVSADSASTATNASNVNITASTSKLYVTGVLTTASGNSVVYKDESVYVQGATVGATTFAGTATNATKLSVSASTSKLYLVGTAATSNGNVTIARDASVYVQGDTITATTFSGSLSGGTISGTNLTASGTVKFTGLGTTAGVVHNASDGTLSSSLVSLSADVTGTLGVAKGGTGATTLTANRLLLGNGTSAISVLAQGTNDYVLVGRGTSAPAWVALSTIMPTLTLDDVGDGTTRKLSNYLPLAGLKTVSGLTTFSAGLTVSGGNLTVKTLSGALYGDSGVVKASSTTATELGYVHGVTSAIQTQLDNKVSRLRVLNNTNGTTWQGIIPLWVLSLKNGYPVNSDTEFKSGNNGVVSYRTGVTMTRVLAANEEALGNADTGTGTGTSTYVLKFTVTGESGFYQSIQSKANKEFAQVFRALLPVGYKFVAINNATGNGRRDNFLTDANGTGKWEWYVRMSYCGVGGTFSTTGYVYVTRSSSSGTLPSADNPVTFYLAECNVYDLTQGSYGALRARYADSSTGVTVTNDNNSTLYFTGVKSTDGTELFNTSGITAKGTALSAGSVKVTGLLESDTGIKINSSNQDRYISFVHASTYSWRIGYEGSGGDNANYLVFESSSNASTWGKALRIGCVNRESTFYGLVQPDQTNTRDLGTSSLKWANVYATKFNGEATNVTTEADTSNALYVVGVTSGATTALKRDTSVTVTGGTLNATTLVGTTVKVGGSSGAILKYADSALQVRNSADSGWGAVKVGNLTVEGTITYINTQDLNVADNIITLNSDVTGTPSENAGIEIERGTSTNASLLWDESNDVWKAGLVGSEKTLAFADLSNISGTLTVAHGGTGVTSLTANRLLVGNGTSAIGVVGVGTTDYVLVGAGNTVPVWKAKAPKASEADSAGQVSIGSSTGKLYVLGVTTVAATAGDKTVYGDASVYVQGGTVGATTFSGSLSGGTISGTTLTASSTVTFSGLGTVAGIVHNNASGVLSSSLVNLASEVIGTLPIGNLPMGIGATQVAWGNHTHSDYINKDGSVSFTAPWGTWGSNYRGIYRDLVRYGNSASSVTGTLLIKTGANTSCMQIVRIMLYNYVTDKSGEILVSGSTSSSNIWKCATVYKSTDNIPDVRLLKGTVGDVDGFYIGIGNTDTSWKYLYVVVSELVASYYVNSAFRTGWTIQLVTEEPTWTSTVTPTPNAGLNADTVDDAHVGVASGNIAVLGSGGVFAVDRIPVLGVAKGGIGLTSYTAGDILYASGASTIGTLGIGTSGYVLVSSGSAPTWKAISNVISAANPTGTVGLTTVNGSASTYMRSDASPALDVNITPTWGGLHTFSSGIYMDTTSGNYLSGMTQTKLITFKSVSASGSNYFPYLRGLTKNSHVWNWGGYEDIVGVYGYYAGRTENGYDWRTTWNVSTGKLTHTKAMDVSGAVALSSTLSVSGNTTLSGTLGVSGATTLAALTASGTVKFTGITTSGVLTISSGTVGAVAVLPLANGGTGATTLAAAGIATTGHTHNYAGSTSAGGSATKVTTTSDTSSTLYVTGVKTGDLTTLRFDTSVTVAGGTLKSATGRIGKVFIETSDAKDRGIMFWGTASSLRPDWQIFMGKAGITSCGVGANITPATGTAVTDYAIRSIVSTANGNGWTWETIPSGTTSAVTSTLVAELSNTGKFKSATGIHSKIFLETVTGSWAHGLSFWQTSTSGRNDWQVYIGLAGTGGCGVAGMVTAPTGTYVTKYAIRSLVSETADSGWTWESCPNGTTTAVTPTIRAELSNTGIFKAAGFVGAGTSITNLNASNLASGTVPIGRIPTGTGATQVAKGDHTHAAGTITGVYYQKVTLDAGYHSPGSLCLIDRNLTDWSRANRFAFLEPAAVDIAFSSDGGTTWSDAGYTDDNKKALFACMLNGNIRVGATTGTVTTSHQTKIELTRPNSVGGVNRYHNLQQIYVYFASSGHAVKLDMSYTKYNDQETYISMFTDRAVSGNAGHNMFNITSSSVWGTGSSIYKIRLVFKVTGLSTNESYASTFPRIYDIRGYGNYPYAKACNMMYNDHLYSWDASQNATFPAGLTVTTDATVYGILKLKANQYTDSAGTGVLNLNNSDIFGVNSIKFADKSDGPSEALQWHRDSTHVDSVWVKDGVMYITPNRAWGGTGTDYPFLNSGNYTSYTVTKSGSGATGTWGISISGNANTATSATSATNATNANVAGIATDNTTVHYLTGVQTFSTSADNRPIKSTSLVTWTGAGALSAVSLTLSGLGSGVVRSSGGSIGTGAINLASSDVTGTLAVENGGIGTSTVTGVLVGAGTGAVSGVSTTTANHVLIKTSTGYGFATVPSHTHNYAGSSSSGGSATTVVSSGVTSSNTYYITGVTAANGTQYYCTGISFNASTKKITATGFVGNLEGNATSATTATSATSATSASSATIADKVKGSYTGSGGKQNPNYFGVNKVGFLMMNTTVNSNSQYKDWMIMDCYSGNDAGGATAFGVNRSALGAYIMRAGSGRTQWDASAELIGTHNYTTYTVKKDGTGASGSWGISITGSAASAGTATTATNVDGGTVSCTTLTASSTVKFTGLSTTAGILHKAADGSISSSAVSLTADVSGVLPVANGGIGISSISAYAIPYASAANTIGSLAIGTVAGYVLAINSNKNGYEWVSRLSSVSTTANYSWSGTHTFTSSKIKIGTTGTGIVTASSGALSIFSVASGDANKYLRANSSGNGFAWADVSVAWGNLTGVPTQFAPSSHNHAAGDINSGTLGVARGGTGMSSIAAYAIPYASAADTFSTIGIGTVAGYVLAINSSKTGYEWVSRLSSVPSHASSATTYGASSASNYGHAKASSTLPIVAGTASTGSETSSFARGDHVHPAQTSVTGSSGSCTGNAASATDATNLKVVTNTTSNVYFTGVTTINATNTARAHVGMANVYAKNGALTAASLKLTGLNALGVAVTDASGNIGKLNVGTGNGGKVLAIKSDSTGFEWVTMSGGGGATTLSGLGDVSLSNVAQGDLLWNKVVAGDNVWTNLAGAATDGYILKTGVSSGVKTLSWTDTAPKAGSATQLYTTARGSTNTTMNYLVGANNYSSTGNKTCYTGGGGYHYFKGNGELGTKTLKISDFGSTLGVLYNSTSGIVSNLSGGTAGQVLGVNSDGDGLEWVPPGVFKSVLVTGSSVTASPGYAYVFFAYKTYPSEVVVTLPKTYSGVIIFIIPTDLQDGVNRRVYLSGGAVWDTSAYQGSGDNQHVTSYAEDVTGNNRASIVPNSYRSQQIIMVGGGNTSSNYGWYGPVTFVT